MDYKKQFVKKPLTTSVIIIIHPFLTEHTVNGLRIPATVLFRSLVASHTSGLCLLGNKKTGSGWLPV